MKRILNLIQSFMDGMKKFFTPNEVFFKLVNSYRKEFIKQYYKDLFDRFFSELKNPSFWISIFYKKSDGIIINIVSYFFLVPLFRFFKVILTCLKNLFYSFYFIFINFCFDLIIKYVDVYARKLRVFYEKSLIDEINEVRRILLFINVVKNFKKIFRPSKKIKIRGHIYQEEWYIRYQRIFFDIILFFIWHMPLILGFISYIVRVIFSLIWGQILIVFWFFAKKFMRRFRRFYIWIRFRKRIYLFKFERLVDNRLSMFSAFKHTSILKVNRLYIFSTKLIQKLYDNVSIFLKPRNKFIIILKIKFSYLFNFILLLKKRDLKLFEINKLKSKYYGLLIKASKIVMTKDIFYTPFFYLKQYIDDIFISRIKPFDYLVNSYTNKRRSNKLVILWFGSLYHKLNLESLYNMFYKFVSTDSFDDYNSEGFIYKSEQAIKLQVDRISLLIDWELFFPIYFFFFKIGLFILLRLYIVSCFFFYLLRCLLSLLLDFLKFIWYIIIIIFFGRQK